MDFKFGWNMDPVTYGRYPNITQELVGDRLPKFSGAEAALVKGSYDFIGLNYYKGFYAKHVANFNPNSLSCSADARILQTSTGADGKLIGETAIESVWYVYPLGFRYLLNYTKDNYNNPIIYITENGYPTKNYNITKEEALDDTSRINFHKNHLWSLLVSMREYNVRVKGYLIWSYLDNYEWGFGYTVGFGLGYVDLKTSERTLKKSATWYNKFLTPNPPH